MARSLIEVVVVAAERMKGSPTVDCGPSSFQLPIDDQYPIFFCCAPLPKYHETMMSGMINK